MVDHCQIGAVNPVPPDVVARGCVITPWLVFEELLPHENHGNTGRCQHQPGRYATAAPGVPGAMIIGISQRRNSRLPGMTDPEDIVVLNVLHALPPFGSRRKL